MTNRCNLRCVHCYYHSPLIVRPNVPERRRRGEGENETESLEAFRKREVDGEVLRGIIGKLLSMGTRRFVFSGGGEPFLHPQALELMQFAAGEGAHCTVNTNGTLLDAHTMDELMRMKFGELRITTMAGTAEVWMRTHPGSKGTVFERMRENLSYVAERKKKEGTRYPQVTLALVITSMNVDSLPDFADFALQAGASEVIFRFFDDVGDRGFVDLLLDREAEERAAKGLLDCLRRFGKAGVRNNVPLVRKLLSAKPSTAPFYAVVPCYYGWLATRISVEGDVYPCCRCYRPFGNAHSGEIDDIWFGDEYRRFRARALAINRGNGPPEDCGCHQCGHYGANLRVYRILHPFSAHRVRLDRLVRSAQDPGKEA
jgi:MoaA/NifB/PqqE/SkfB family radical SAM enzyme